MLRFLLPLSLAGSIALSACVAATASISGIQKAAVTACGFLPTVQTLEALIALNNPLLVSVNQIASAVCAAVAPAKTAAPMARLFAAPATPTTVPKVLGVPIHGKFVR